MGGTGAREQDQAPPSRTPWPAARLMVEFVLDIADIARDGGPVLDTLILVVIIEANVAPVSRDPSLDRAYGALGAPPPDDIRRPVSINAVAASLGLPFETVRRRVRRLAAKGECLIGPSGVIVPAARLTSPTYVRIAVARYERMRRLYHDLQAVGAFLSAGSDGEGDGGPSPRPVGPEPPVRLCNRLLSEYYLRVTELMMRRVGDPVSWLVLLGVARANMAALTPEARAAPYLHPYAMRRPVRRTALAASLGLPVETVRRRLLDLERRGYCRATPHGVLLAPEAVLRPHAQQALRENEANLARLMARLRRYGVLARWDAEAAAAAAAA